MVYICLILNHTFNFVYVMLLDITLEIGLRIHMYVINS